VLKYRDGLHRYIQDKMEFWTYHPWERLTDMPSKSSRISNKRRDNLGLGTPRNKTQERAAPTHRTKDKENMGNLRTTSLGPKKRRTQKEKERYQEMV
jgi:hypothetical protein